MHSLRLLILALFPVSIGCAIGPSFSIPEQVVRGDRQSCLYHRAMTTPVIAEFPLRYRCSGTYHGVSPAHLADMSLWNTATARTSGDADDFSFIRRIDVFVRFSDGSGRVRIASWSGPRPDGIYSLDLEPDRGVDLGPYLERPAIVSAESAAEVPCSDTSFEGYAEIETATE